MPTRRVQGPQRNPTHPIEPNEPSRSSGTRRTETPKDDEDIEATRRGPTHTQKSERTREPPKSWRTCNGTAQTNPTLDTRSRRVMREPALPSWQHGCRRRPAGAPPASARNRRSAHFERELCSYVGARDQRFISDAYAISISPGCAMQHKPDVPLCRGWARGRSALECLRCVLDFAYSERLPLYEKDVRSGARDLGEPAHRCPE